MAVGLEGPFPVDPEVTLADLRAQQTAVYSARAAITAGTKATSYFPFEVSTKRPLRPAQFYLAKLPASVVALFPSLAGAASDAAATSVGVTVPAPPVTTVKAGGLGRPYRSRPEPTKSSPSDPWSVDPDVLDRGRKGHWATQEALASYVDSLGAKPREPEPDEPQYDVGWELGGDLYVAEVKSLTKANQESQLRLELGQVLRYRHLVGAATTRTVRAVLAVEMAPADVPWSDLCVSLEVVLVWPGNMRVLNP